MIDQFNIEGTDDGEQPPPYSATDLCESVFPTDTSIRTQAKDDGFIDYNAYLLPSFTLSADCTTRTTNHGLTLDNPCALQSCLQSQAKLPPQLWMQITWCPTNRRLENDKTNVNFNLKLDLTPLLIADGKTADSNYEELTIKAPPPDAKVRRGSELEYWCRSFRDDLTDHKIFVFERFIAPFNRKLLQQSVSDLFASLHYESRVEVYFHVSETKLVICKEHHSSFDDGLSLSSTLRRSLFPRRQRSVRAESPAHLAEFDNTSHVYRPVQTTWLLPDDQIAPFWTACKNDIVHAILAHRSGWIGDTEIDVILGHRPPTLHCPKRSVSENVREALHLTDEYSSHVRAPRRAGW